MTTSQARLRGILPEQLDESQRRLYDAVLGGPRATKAGGTQRTTADGALKGPFNAMLLSPGIGHALQDLGAAVRFGVGLADAVREMVILLVAGHFDSAYERHAHEPIARTLGVGEDVLRVLAAGEVPRLEDPHTDAVLRLAADFLAGRKLDDAGYAAYRDALGERTIFEASVLVGYYSMLAQQLEVFGVRP